MLRSALALFLCASAACARDPLDPVCPEVGAGGLVISEIRGAQAGSGDVGGQWVEIYNATNQSVNLAGLALTMRKINGSAEARIMVRDHDLVVAAGAYATLGRFDESALPAHVSYGFAQDFGDNLYSAAQVELSACGEVIDQVVYRSLPTAGTLGFDGGKTLSATANDDEKAWCVDGSGVGHPGTPLMRNNACATP
jgi:lamin tail-like protein